MKRVLLLGTNGMLGSMLAQQFPVGGGLTLFAAVRKDISPFLSLVHFGGVMSGLDALDFNPQARDRLTEFVKIHDIDVLVNCIGVIKQRAAGQDPVVTTAVNALFPQWLASICSSVGVRLIHISTDCVFSGSTGNYVEGDIPDASDYYGRTKALGEVGAPHLTLRTSVIGPELPFNEGLGLMAWFLSQKGPAVSGYTKAIFSGVTTLTLAGLIRHVVLEQPELAGLFHVSSMAIDKCALLQKINAAFGRKLVISPDDALQIDRSLNGERLFTQIGWQAPSWDEQLASLNQWCVSFAAHGGLSNSGPSHVAD